MRCRRSISTASAALSLSIKERSNGGIELAYSFDKLFVRHGVELIDVHVDVARQERCDDAKEVLRAFLDHFCDDRWPLTFPGGEDVFEEGLA